MENLFVSVQTAQLLKEKGFNEPCIKYIYQGDTANNTDIECECIFSQSKDWNNEGLCISIPLYCQVIDWIFNRAYNYEESEYREIVYAGSKSRHEIEEEIKEALKLI